MVRVGSLITLPARVFILPRVNASPEENDPDGKASRFIGTHEKLGVVQEYEGSLTGVIDGTPYTGDFKEEAHDHE